MSPATDRVEFLRPRELPGIEALHAERCGRLWRVYHDTYTVCTNFRVEGFAEWRYRRKLYRSSGGGQMFMQPGELHANTQVRGPGNFRVLLISPALVERTALELGLRARVNLRTAYTEDDPQLFDAFAQLHASLERPALALERQSRLAQCLRLFIERCTESPPADH